MAQLDLIPKELLPDNYQLPADPEGRSTGERVQRDRPDLYEAVVRAGAELMGIRQTSRALGLHRDTVAAIFEREEARIGTLKEITARNLRRFAAIASERALEEVDKLQGVQLFIAQGIAIEKAQLLEGQATSITETRDSPRIGSLDELVDNMRRVTPLQTGSHAGADGQKALAGPVPGGSERPAIGASVDEQSTGGSL